MIHAQVPMHMPHQVYNPVAQHAPYPFTATVGLTPCCGAQYEPQSLFNFVNTYGVCPNDRRPLSPERLIVVHNPARVNIIINQEIARPRFSLLDFLWNAAKSIAKFTFKVLAKTCEILWEIVKFALKALATLAAGALAVSPIVAFCMLAPEAAIIIGFHLAVMTAAVALAVMDERNARHGHHRHCCFC